MSGISAIKDVYASNNGFKNPEAIFAICIYETRVLLGARILFAAILITLFAIVQRRRGRGGEEGRKITFCMRIAESQEMSIHSPLGEDGPCVHVRALDP